MPHMSAPVIGKLATKDTMSQFFSLSFFIAYSAAILQLSFLAFSNVLDDGILTYIAVGLGISSAPAIRLFQKWKHAKSASYLITDEPGQTPFHQRLINFPLLTVFSTFGFIGLISISNHIFASEEVHVEEFVVEAIGKKRVRYDLFEYILISNGDYATSLNLGETPKTTYSVGDKLEVTLKTGLWGYYIVEDVVNGG